jgi:hypothetical protein
MMAVGIRFYNALKIRINSVREEDRFAIVVSCVNNELDFEASSKRLGEGLPSNAQLQVDLGQFQMAIARRVQGRMGNVDAWGMPVQLQFSFSDGKLVLDYFSAGPDRRWGTPDDLHKQERFDLSINPGTSKYSH